MPGPYAHMSNDTRNTLLTASQWDYTADEFLAMRNRVTDELAGDQAAQLFRDLAVYGIG